ncbi:hypothetical protein LX36DRAFT_670612 [Colletotrichum falcatum]|nr:hypothetical protein LX36DRAFT_670612 [Colletotrichum falcatum]
MPLQRFYNISANAIPAIPLLPPRNLSTIVVGLVQRRNSVSRSRGTSLVLETLEGSVREYTLLRLFSYLLKSLKLSLYLFLVVTVLNICGLFKWATLEAVENDDFCMGWLYRTAADYYNKFNTVFVTLT